MSEDGLAVGERIHEAVRFLAGHCDGARSRDDAGFNGYDASSWGHEFAKKPALTVEQQARALRGLHKYKNTQLKAGGFDVEDLLIDFAIAHPSVVSGNGSGKVRSLRERTVVDTGEDFVVKLPFMKDLRDEFKNALLGGRDWIAEEKVWRVELSYEAKLRQFANKHGFKWTEDPSWTPRPRGSGSVEHGNGNGSAPTVEARKIPGRVITVEDGRFAIRNPFSRDLLPPIRNLPGRRWDNDAKVDRVPLHGAAAVAKFAANHGFMLTSEAQAAIGSLAAVEDTPAAPTVHRFIDVELEVAGGAAQTFVIRNERNYRLDEALRRIPERRRDRARDAHVVPITRCLEVEQFGNQWDYTFSTAAREIIDEYREAARAEQERVAALIAASEALATDRKLPIDGGIYPFQAAGIDYMLARRRTFQGDDMGLGKTVQALGAVEVAHQERGDGYPLLIVCPKSLVLNWEKEIRQWHERWGVQRSVEIVTSRSYVGLFGAPDIRIIHYDILKARLDVLTDDYKSLICDEAHYLKNPKATRTKMVQFISSHLGEDPMILLLTGTAVVNGKVAEMGPQLKIMRRLDDFDFKKYCGGKATSDEPEGALRQSQLHNQFNVELRTNCFLRRTKPQALPQLPARRIVSMPLALTNEAEYRYAESAFLAWVRERHGWEAMSRAERAETLVRLNGLRRLCGQGKTAGTLEWVRSMIESGNKMVVFAHHQDVLDPLLHGLRDFNPRRIDASQRGDTGALVRQQNVEDFQSDESVRVIVCSLMSGSVGLTMTASSNPVLVELPWTPKDRDQAIDRCHRIGQVDSVTGWVLVGPNTVDDYLAEILEEKSRANSEIQDGRASADDEQSVLGTLVGRMVDAADARSGVLGATG